MAAVASAAEQAAPGVSGISASWVEWSTWAWGQEGGDTYVGEYAIQATRHTLLNREILMV